MRVTYDTLGFKQAISTITDSLGREIRFENEELVPDDPRSVRTKKIDLLGFKGSPGIDNDIKMSYLFSHSYRMAVVPDVGSGLDVTARLKRSVLQLDSIQMPMGYVTTFAYGEAGEITQRSLPMNEYGSSSGPRVVYRYNYYEYYDSTFMGSTLMVGLGGGGTLIGCVIRTKAM